MTYDTNVTNVTTTYNVQIDTLLDTVHAAHYLHNNTQQRFRLLSNIFTMLHLHPLIAHQMLEILAGVLYVL